MYWVGGWQDTAVGRFMAAATVWGFRFHVPAASLVERMDGEDCHGVRDRVDAIVGVSCWAEGMRADVLRVARHDSNVLVSGPSGTGKELVARAIHAHSRRAAAPFVPVDCAALPSELFVSQMFGHVKGAFTGAHTATLGAFRAAAGGTIFLDEVGELDPALQAKLLRVLQERTVIPVGSPVGKPIDVRIVAATNRHLEALVSAGHFRADLYYRLNVVSLQTIPLKDRPDDVEVLARHFLHKLAIDAGFPLKRLSPGALELLRMYDWPGNVRELNNQLERAAVFSEQEVLGGEALSQLIQLVMAQRTASGPPVSPPPDDASSVFPSPPAAPPGDSASNEPAASLYRRPQTRANSGPPARPRHTGGRRPRSHGDKSVRVPPAMEGLP